MGRPYEVGATGSGSHTSFSEEERAAAAEAALEREEWSAAHAAWHDLACAIPQNTHYRTQLMFARAGELLAGGHVHRARAELDRVLRADPKHAGAAALMKKLPRTGAFSRLLGR